MRVNTLVRTVAVATAAIAAGTFALAGTAQASGTPTVRTVLRPVTATGHAAQGYTVRKQLKYSVDCSFTETSPAAVDRDIVLCAPDAAYAVACWKGAAAHTVLCFQDARKKQLVEYRAKTVAQTRPYRIKAPLDLRLVDGTYCTIRIGGAGGTLKQHPRWIAYYYCTGGKTVWASMNDKHWGVHRANPVWTVNIAGSGRNAKVHQRAVKQAWFVGTVGV